MSTITQVQDGSGAVGDYDKVIAMRDSSGEGEDDSDKTEVDGNSEDDRHEEEVDGNNEDETTETVTLLPVAASASAREA